MGNSTEVSGVIMAGGVSQRLGRDKVDEIIEEEMRHITMLSEELLALKRLKNYDKKDSSVNVI